MLVIPLDKRVRIVEVSKDVIHSFWVPEFLFKRDVIPKPDPNQFEFTATQIGHYVGRCAELCGTYHSQMNFEVRVVSDDDYAKYLTNLAAIPSSDPARQSKALTVDRRGPVRHHHLPVRDQPAAPLGVRRRRSARRHQLGGRP